jgi:hypothetical protein
LDDPLGNRHADPRSFILVGLVEPLEYPEHLTAIELTFPALKDERHRSSMSRGLVRHEINSPEINSP